MITFDNLYEHQKDAIKFIAHKRGRCLLHLPMGSGKTLTSIFLIKKYEGLLPTLIITPASIKLQWASVINEYFPEKEVVTLEGSPTEKDLYLIKRSSFVIINYDILSKYKDILKDEKFNLVICDESHKIKNPSANRTKALYEIVDKIEHRLLLTGTPITNSVVDLYSPLHIIDPINFNSYTAFQKRYAPPKPIVIKSGLLKKTINIPGEPTNVGELNNIVSNYFFRVSEKEVYKNIPEMQNIVVPIAVDSISDYKIAESIFLKSKVDNNKSVMEAEANLANARKLLGCAKVDSAVDWIKEQQEVIDNKLVVFAYHRSVVEDIYEKLGGSSKCVKYYGGMNSKEKDEAINEFINNKKVRFFVCNCQSAGTGVDGLQEVSNTAVFVETVYSYAEQAQAKARVRRKNSKYNNYFCYNLIVKDTLDEKILKVMDRKAMESSEILEGKPMSNKELLSELLK